MGEEVGSEILHRWEEVLTGLEGDRASVATTVDWVAKERVYLAYQERHGIDWDDVRLRAMDLQYHDLREDRSLFARLGMERLCSSAEVERAVTEPPDTTRAYFRVVEAGRRRLLAAEDRCHELLAQRPGERNSASGSLARHPAAPSPPRTSFTTPVPIAQMTKTVALQIHGEEKNEDRGRRAIDLAEVGRSGEVPAEADL